MATGDYRITLYSYRGCPYVHRVVIALKELGLTYEEVPIDLDVPRDPAYLQINPRGLVPALRISAPNLGGEHILIESAIIVQFLADIVPGHLLPPSTTPSGAISRARLNYFLDTWNNKIGSFMFNMFRANTPSARESLSQEWVVAVKKEIEPLLADAKPYFGGSSRLTLAEINIAPFVMRIFALADADVLPKSVANGLSTLPNFKKWTDAIRQEQSVLSIWNAETFVARTRSRLDRMKTTTPKAH